MFKFVFAFHIFLLENSFINRVDKFVFDTHRMQSSRDVNPKTRRS